MAGLASLIIQNNLNAINRMNIISRLELADPYYVEHQHKTPQGKSSWLAVILWRRDWVKWTMRRYTPGYKNRSWRRHCA